MGFADGKSHSGSSKTNGSRNRRTRYLRDGLKAGWKSPGLGFWEWLCNKLADVVQEGSCSFCHYWWEGESGTFGTNCSWHPPVWEPDTEAPATADLESSICHRGALPHVGTRTPITKAGWPQEGLQPGGQSNCSIASSSWRGLASELCLRATTQLSAPGIRSLGVAEGSWAMQDSTYQNEVFSLQS